MRLLEKSLANRLEITEVGLEPRPADPKTQALSHMLPCLQRVQWPACGWEVSTGPPVGLAGLAAWVSSHVLPAWVSFLLSPSQQELLASLGPAQCPSSSFQVGVRGQGHHLWTFQSLRHMDPTSWYLDTGAIPWVRTGQLCRVAASDWYLLGQVSWSLGYLFHEALHS